MAARHLWRRRRLALGLVPTPGPGLGLLMVGVALGPQALGVLSNTTLDALDPVISLALASLGVFVGLDLRLRGARERVLLAAGSLEAGVTIAVVALGYAVLARFAPGVFPHPALSAILIGICAASSSTIADYDETADHKTRVGDFDDVLPIALAGALAFWTRAQTPTVFVQVVLQTTAIAGLLAGATVLLIRQTGTEGEQRVFTIGAVLLLGGVAAHLSLSALALGVIAGLCWNLAGGESRDRIMRDLQYLQHPLTVPLLIFAGARLRTGTALIALLLLYVALRTIGRTFGSYVSQRVALGIRRPTLPRLHLTSPGVIGIGIALETLRGHGLPHGAAVLSVVVSGALALELLALVVVPEDGVVSEDTGA